MDLKEILGEELYKQVEGVLGDNRIDIINNGNWIPKAKFDTLNTDLKEMRTVLADRDKQLKDIGNYQKDNEDLKVKIEELTTKNKQIQTDFENKIAQREFDLAFDGELTSHNPKNLKAIKGLLDMEKVVFKDGKLTGLDEQIKSLKETDSYLFEVVLGGQEPNNGGASASNKNPFSREFFNLTEQGRLFKENPNLAQTMMAEANK